MATFRRITKRDDPAKMAALAAKYEALLNEALGIARQRAAAKPQLVRDILATGTVEGLVSPLKAKVAAVRYRAEKYKREWNSLIGWQYLRGSNAADWADSMIETIETTIHMTETDSWPRPPTRRRRKRKRAR